MQPFVRVAGGSLFSMHQMHQGGEMPTHLPERRASRRGGDMSPSGDRTPSTEENQQIDQAKVLILECLKSYMGQPKAVCEIFDLLSDRFSRKIIELAVVRLHLIDYALDKIDNGFVLATEAT